MTALPRVVLFDAYPHLLGGGQRTLLAVAAELQHRGTPPTLVVPGEGILADRARNLDVPVVVVTLPSALGRYGRATTRGAAVAALAALPTAWRRLWAAFAGAEADVVHAQDHRGVLLAAPAARAARLPVVWHAHSVDVGGRAIEAGAGRLVAALVAPSHAALAALRRVPARVPRSVVRPPLDDSVLHAAPAQGRGTGRLVTAARLHPAKGLDDAVRAVAALAAAGLDVQLDVYGGVQEGSEAYASSLRDLTERLAVAGRVHFHGEVAAPHEHWRDADLYLQPSRAETFGMAAAEAMAMGLPVVATRVGGLPELVKDLATGRLVAPGDPGALAGAVRDLLADPEGAAAMGAAARASVADLSVAGTVDRLLAVWQRARR